MEPRGRGRARGRARGSVQQTSGGAAPRPGQGAPGPAPAPLQGAWARGPQQPRPAQPPQQQPQPQQPAWIRQPTAGPSGPQGGAGRGLRHGGGDEGGYQAPPVQVVGPGSSGDQTTPLSSEGRRGGGGGNGGVRGRANRNEILRTRPTAITSKCGQTGQRLKLQANYFELMQNGRWFLNEYRVDFSPDVDHTGQRKKLVWTALQEVVKGYLFDGTVLYTPQTINPDPLEKFVDDEKGEKIRVSMRRVGDVTWGDPHYIQLFNLIIRKLLKYLDFKLIGRNYFDPVAKITINEHKLELWPGFYTSARQHENSILMTADTLFKVMRTDNMYDMFLSCGSDLREYQSKVIEQIVLTPYNNKTYRIDDVDVRTTPASTFAKKDGTQITYIEYFKQRYNINIRNPHQPMLVSRSKEREIRAGMPETVMLVPELCQLTGLNDQQRQNFQLMSALANHTRMAPEGRITKLMKFCERLAGNKECVAELQRWDLTIARKLVELSGRQLPPETILLGGGRQVSAGNDASWTNEFRKAQMVVSEPLKYMVVIYPSKMQRQTEEFIKTLQTVSRGMQFQIDQIKPFAISHDGINGYLEALEKVLSGPRPTLIMCCLFNQNLDRYSAIKKKCTVDRGVPTQILVNRSMTHKTVMSIATKVAIQLNCKIGGAPWSVNVPIAKMMVVGYDVCRDTAKKSKSYGALVASLDRHLTRYTNYVTEHQNEEELSNNFATMLIMAMYAYKEVNGEFPEKLLIYRDGVGAGQLPYVIEHEVKHIEDKLQKEIYKETKLNLIFLIVSKRINTRVFHNARNPPPGTIVDDVITLPERYDFFVVPQCVRQGTVAPTSYNVIRDTWNLLPDRLQIITYKLCHMYYNWSGTVRVPAPCQYAHKLAFFVAKILHRQPHKDLSKTLFYL